MGFRLLRALGTAERLTADVQLAAFAIEHQGELHSNDGDFGRFPDLRWLNPLQWHRERVAPPRGPSRQLRPG